MNLLKLSKGNAKLSKDTLILSISAGISCPGSSLCKAFVTVKDDKGYLIEVLKVCSLALRQVKN